MNKLKASIASMRLRTLPLSAGERNVTPSAFCWLRPISGWIS